MVKAAYCLIAMQEKLTEFMKDPRTQIQECWREQASANVDDHVMLCEIDTEVVESTRHAMIQELVNWEAVNSL